MVESKIKDGVRDQKGLLELPLFRDCVWQLKYQYVRLLIIEQLLGKADDL